jgi:diguanylate cyclase (GGDEF)-like protein
MMSRQSLPRKNEGRDSNYGIKVAFIRIERMWTMINPLKRLLRNTMAALELRYRVVRGMDYRTLSQYILKINKHRDIDDILYEISRCLKDILDYELFGFALKSGQTMDLWIDPRMYSAQIRDFVVRDYGSQKIDCTMHNFENKVDEMCHIPDAVDVNDLLSYNVIDGEWSARLYILPKKKMFYYHNAIMSTIISSISIALEKNMSIQQLESAAAIDPLTNCYNRRALDTLIENDIAYAQRNNKELSVIMLDMDSFKEINDVYGHLAGDAALKAVSSLIPTLVRKTDYLARYGGEEFVLVLPDSSLYNAVQLAHRIRKAIEAQVVQFNEQNIRVSASFGVSCLEQKLDGSCLLQEADERLYKAKSLGKNNVVPSLLPCFADAKFITQKSARDYAAAGRLM